MSGYKSENPFLQSGSIHKPPKGITFSNWARKHDLEGIMGLTIQSIQISSIYNIS